MKIAVIGATGKSGLFVVEQGLAEGHVIVALIRTPSKLSIVHDNLIVRKTNVFDEDSLSEGFAGCDVVLSCLGGVPGCSRVSLYSDSIEAITGAMRRCGINRLVAMTSAYARPSAGESCCIACCLRGIFLGRILADMVRMEDFLHETCADIQWTAVKPPGLSMEPLTERIVMSFEGEYVPGTQARMPRANVAKFMLEQITANTWHNRIVAIALTPLEAK